jgi:DNA-binding transcriptional LysR family regulator
MATLSPRQVEAFRALMLTGSVSAGARLMNVTQPAVSRLLRDLQHALSLKLFERHGSRLVPTSEALSLYGEVERSFVGLHRIAQAAAELRTRRAGGLRIAALPALANGFQPRFVGRFLADRPKIDLALYGLISHLVLDWVVSGQCEVGFAETPAQHPAISLERMPAVAMVAVLPRAHPLAKRKVIRPRDLAGEPFISLGHSTVVRFRIDTVFADNDVERVMRVETPLSEIACALAAAGIGIAICDPFTAREYAPRGLAVRRFEPRIMFEVGALYSAQRGLSAVAREFIDSFAAHVRAFTEAQARAG